MKSQLSVYFIGILFFMLVGADAAQAQYNGTALGIRGGARGGLTIKGMGKGPGAIEGIVGFYPNSLNVTVLWEHYQNAFDVQNLYWYYGLGGHAAFYNTLNNGRYPRWYGDAAFDDTGIGLGVDAILGLEYLIQTELPFDLAVSVDAIPFLEVNTAGGAYFWVDPGLGVKVVF
ncbi:hypothetical protein [Halocola ammonii]